MRSKRKNKKTQVIFTILALVLVLSMVLSLVVTIFTPMA